MVGGPYPTYIHIPSYITGIFWPWHIFSGREMSYVHTTCKYPIAGCIVSYSTLFPLYLHSCWSISPLPSRNQTENARSKWRCTVPIGSMVLVYMLTLGGILMGSMLLYIAAPWIRHGVGKIIQRNGHILRLQARKDCRSCCRSKRARPFRMAGFEHSYCADLEVLGLVAFNH